MGKDGYKCAKDGVRFYLCQMFTGLKRLTGITSAMDQQNETMADKAIKPSS